MKARIQYIDIAKGLSILFVASNHSEFGRSFSTLILETSTFRLPLFFFLSGIFFSSNTSFKIFFLTKFDALLKPYYFTLFSILSVSLFIGNQSWVKDFIGILYGTGSTIVWPAMWFLPQLFFVSVVSYFCIQWLKTSRNPFWLGGVLVLLLFFVGLAVLRWYNDNFQVYSNSGQPLGLPFSLDVSLIAMSYFISGFLLKDLMIKLKPNWWLVLLSLIVLVILATLTDAFLELNQRIVNIPLVVLVSSVLGIYLVLCLAYLIALVPYLSRVFRIIGSSSLFILIFHSSVGYNFYHLFDGSISGQFGQEILAFLAFVVSVALPVLIRYLVSMSSFLSLFYLPLKSNRIVHSRLSRSIN